MTREEIVTATLACIREGTCAGCPLENHGPGCTRVLLESVLPYVEAQTPQGSQDATEMPEPWSREKVLADAKRCVCGEREQDYGTPEDNFGRIAKLWSAYMGVEFTPVDVSMLMVMLKAARIKSGGGTMDSFVDGCGYFSCGGEIFARNLESSERV